MEQATFMIRQNLDTFVMQILVSQMDMDQWIISGVAQTILPQSPRFLAILIRSWEGRWSLRSQLQDGVCIA